MTILEQLPPTAELAMAYSNRAQLHMLAQEHQQVVLWGSRAIELAEKLGKQNAAGLTSRQVEVLALMVDGISNAEIGHRLFISIRTVDK